MPHRVLNEDWSEYDNKKIRDNRDRFKFSCEEKWEVDYLVEKLKKHFPLKNEFAFREAIFDICHPFQSRERKDFVEAVLWRLS